MRFAVDEPLMDSSFAVTNGAQSFTVTLIETGPGQLPALDVHGCSLPPRGTDLWVVQPVR